MKLLYILNVANRINNFCISSIIAAKESTFEVHVAGNWAYNDTIERKTDEQKYGVCIHQIDFERTPFCWQNLKAYKQLKLLFQRERFDIVHCNTPIGGLLGRIIAKKYNVKHVIYQVHGFHFYQGSPKINWMLYYPVEKYLAHFTDTLITINTEDYSFAKKKLSLRNNGKVFYVPGVGLDLSQIKFGHTEREFVRASLGLIPNDIVLISVGRLDVNKNNEMILRAIADVPQIKLIVCGDGEQMSFLKDLSLQLGLTERVQFLGNRSDIYSLYNAADIFVLMSHREGLSRSIMEAMAVGLPCVVSDIRGNRDLIINNQNGILCEPKNKESISSAIRTLSSSVQLRKEFEKENLLQIKRYSINVVVRELKQIYKQTLLSINN